MYLGSNLNYNNFLQWPNVKVSTVTEYFVTNKPSTLVFTVDEVKSWLKIPTQVTDQDFFISLLIKAVTEYFETYTNRILINTGYIAYKDYFTQVLNFTKGKRQSLDSFEYLSDKVYIQVPTDSYQLLEEEFYWRIIFLDTSNIPRDKDDVFQSVKIQFTAGYGESSDDVPSDIKIAMLNHIASLYENRGDCDVSLCSSCSNYIPRASALIYDKYRHISLY